MDILKRNPRVAAITSASAISLAGVGLTAWRMDGLNETVQHAGAFVPEEAISSTSFLVDGVPAFTLSIVPASLKTKVIVGAIGFAVTGLCAYYAYKFIRKETKKS